MYVRKEALLSSQIEGTQSSLSDLLLFENHEIPQVPLDDVTEVSNYVAAIDHGISRLRLGFPLSLRLLKEMHQILLRSGRGASKQPGEFRSSQNWIGGTKPGNALFVPPPPDKLIACLDPFERFLHDPVVPPLIRAGLAHVQFETIHPFLDGNGRLGRLLVTLMLCEAGVLRDPILYLSLFLKIRRDDYYRLLQEVRLQGSWESWMEFFLTGVAETAEQATSTAKELMILFDRDRQKIAEFGRAASSMLRVHELLQRRPNHDPGGCQRFEAFNTNCGQRNRFVDRDRDRPRDYWQAKKSALCLSTLPQSTRQRHRATPDLGPLPQQLCLPIKSGSIRRALSPNDNQGSACTPGFRPLVVAPPLRACRGKRCSDFHAQPLLRLH